ncbi:MAG: NADH-quinone oxidoreductase subunit M [Chloroherpetonaceae bacterium]|nr:NADH-quinone oxidoreductase subunit M [Chloroherpetonaceae bacterium]MDW8438067.1 NADH-quinone oxidoreductase subunit M [Chloroherpetonaceae bacterium]
MGSSLLTLTIFFPFLFGIPLLFFSREKDALSKFYALAISLIVLAMSLTMLLNFDGSQGAQFQHVALEDWLGEEVDVKYVVGLDGLSALLFAFSAFVFPLTILGTWTSVQRNVREHLFFLLALETCVLGVFAALDLFLYYVFWEAMLIPMYFLIGIWGGEKRVFAATKFFVYMLSASLIMLVGIIYVGIRGADLNGGVFTTDYQKLTLLDLPFTIQAILFWLFAVAFLAKAPLFPLHSWLPEVYAQSPVSAVVTGVLLKMATYALIRFNAGLFPQAAAHFSTLLAVLSAISILYGAAIAFAQKEMRLVLAYSSISHLGFLTLGIFAFTEEAMQGAILQMVNHGLSTGLLFLLAGFLYERRRSDRLSDYGGLKKAMPLGAMFFMIATLASVGLPGLNGFVGEFLILAGAFKSPVLHSGAFAALSAIGVILSVVYMLPMFQKIFLGELKNDLNANLKDLNLRETIVATAFVVVIVWIGVAPNSFLKLSEKSVATVIEKVQQNSSLSSR